MKGKLLKDITSTSKLRLRKIRRNPLERNARLQIEFTVVLGGQKCVPDGAAFGREFNYLQVVAVQGRIGYFGSPKSCLFVAIYRKGLS